MTLSLAIVVTLLVEVMSALTLIAVSARLRLVGDRRIAIEATLALGSAEAEFRVNHADSLTGLAAGAARALPLLTLSGGWNAAAVAVRPDSAELVVLRTTVRRLNSAGHLVAGSQGTLLLHRRTADTALVIGHWPRF